MSSTINVFHSKTQYPSDFTPFSRGKYDEEYIDYVIELLHAFKAASFRVCTDRFLSSFMRSPILEVIVFLSAFLATQQLSTLIRTAGRALQEGVEHHTGHCLLVD